MLATTNYVVEGTHFASVGTPSSFNDETHRQYLGYCPEISSRCTSDSVSNQCARMAEWTATARTSALSLIILNQMILLNKVIHLAPVEAPSIDAEYSLILFMRVS